MKIIAEIGLNHCGSLERAQNLFDQLVSSSVDGITFQIREASFYDRSHPRKCPLPDEFYLAAVKQAKAKNKSIGFAIADPERIGFFFDLGADFWKTLSWDLTNHDLLTKLSRTKKQIYASTGVSGLDDILMIASSFEEIDFIHTQLDYECTNVNLRAIETIRQTSKRNVAFGLHCKHHNVLYAATALAPSALFIYVKDDTNGEHPDDLHAIRLSSIDLWVNQLKEVATALGDGVKRAHENKLHVTAR